MRTQIPAVRSAVQQRAHPARVLAATHTGRQPVMRQQGQVPVNQRSKKDASNCGHTSRAPSCLSCESRTSSEWCSLNDEDVRYLSSIKLCRTYRQGEVLFYQGNPCMGIHCIESGSIALRKIDAAGNTMLLRIVSAGDTLGYASYFSGGLYQASAEALTDSRVCFIDRTGVKALLERSPALGYRFLHKLAQDVEGSDEARLQASAMPLRGRFAHLLLVLKERFGTVDDEGSMSIALPMSRQDIAAMLGTRPETIARLIRTFDEEGIAHFDGRAVRVPDLDGLLDEVEAYTMT